MYAINVVSYEFQHEGQRMVVTRRDGASADMIAHTVMHFRLAKAALKLGILHLDNCPAAYADSPDVNMDAPHVTVWGDAIYNRDGAEIKISLNVCTESTTANDLLAGVAALSEGLAQSKAIDITEYLPAATPMQPTAQPQPLANTSDDFHQAAQSNGGKVDLAQQFPRTDTTPDATKGKPASTKSADKTDGKTYPVIEAFDHTLIESYQAEYLNKQVEVRIGKIEHHWQVKNDGSSPYACIDFYPLYGDDMRVSKYPAFALRKFPAKPDSKAYNFTENKLLRQLVPEPGQAVEGDFYIRYKLNRAKDGDGIFWNIYNVSGIDTATTANSDDTATDDLSEADYAELRGLPGSEIPF